ncbi:MAG: SDR family oxidoreductase [Isosphaeraceae bacterium]
MLSGRMLGRSCLIVGGTSGIGLATAKRFLHEGARVVVTGLHTESTHEALPVLQELGSVWTLPLDVSDPEAVDNTFQVALRLLGDRLDVVFHVAGQSGRRWGDGSLDACTLAAWDGVLDANARGTFLTNQAAVRRMLEQPRDEHGLRGTILNLGSVIDQSPSPDYFGTIAYAASKGAVRALTRAAAARYARDGIRFNLLVPGLIDTPMAQRAVNDPTIRSYLTTKQALTGHPGTSADCAEAALYLCEPASRFVTGAELVVDGGWRLSEGQFVPPVGASQIADEAASAIGSETAPPALEAPPES